MAELKDRYIRFDWAIKRLLRQKANFGVLEGFLTVFLNEPIKIVDILESEGNQQAAEDKFNRASNPQPIGFSGILLAKRQNSFYCTYFLHNRNVADTKSPYPIKRLEVIRWFNQKSMVFNQSLS